MGAAVLAPVAVAARQHTLHTAALTEWAAGSSVVLRLTGTGARAWLAERKGDVHLLIADAERRPAIFAAVGGQPQIPRAKLDASLARILSSFRRSQGAQFTRIWVFDAAGRLLGSSEGAAASPSRTVRSVARASLGVDSVLVSQIFTRADRSSALAFAERVVAAPQRSDSSATLLGSIVLVIDPRLALFPALDGGSVGARGERTALLMAHGDSVFEYSLTADGPRAPQVRPGRGLSRFEQVALDQPTVGPGAGAAVAHVLAGGSVVELVRPVPGVDWAVVRRATPAAVFSAADAELFSECALVLVVAVMAAAGVLFRSRSIQVRRTRDLAESERRLRGALEFVRALVDSSPVAIIALDLDGDVTLWNGAAERYFGWTAAEIMGKPYPLAPGDLWDEMVRHTEATLAHGHLSDVHLRRRKKDGALIDVSLSTGVIHGPNGAPVGILALVTDLSERAQLEAQLRQAQKMDAIGQLAGGIAHDFNNLLTVITSYASLLLQDFPPQSSTYADVTEIRAAAQRAAGLTGQLLAFSRQQVFNPHAVDVNTLVTTLKQMLRRVLPANVELRTELSPDLACARADEGQLGQVLMNLVVNARDAIGDVPGIITISTACSTEDSSGRSQYGPNSDVIITVADTGRGMPQHVIERIFEPFFTTKDVGEGTGLGLSTVHGIIAQSGGRITVESEVGHGSTFALHLPVLDEGREASGEYASVSSAAPDRGERAGGSSVGGGIDTRDGLRDGTQPRIAGTVLLVEDEAHVRTAMTRMLTRDGFQVIAAADATEALTLYEQSASTIDLVLTDMAMPGLTGAELVARLRGVGSDVPALFMSGHLERGALTASVLSDPSRFIQKPFTPDALTRKVREAIAQHLARTGAWRVPPASLTAISPYARHG